MAHKKYDRIQVTTRAGIVHGYVYKTGTKITMMLDDGKRLVKASPAAFTRSEAPLPADSPFNAPIEQKGARVQFEHEGRALQGIVIKGDMFEARIRAGLMEITIPQGDFQKSDIEVPLDPPTPMDRWSVRKYKPVNALSEETIAFTAEILLDGRKVIDASNQGHGGCNTYHGERQYIDQLEADATVWATLCGDERPSESADTWVGWYGEDKPIGVTATEHFAESKARWDGMVAEHGEPGAPRM